MLIAGYNQMRSLYSVEQGEFRTLALREQNKSVLGSKEQRQR